MNLVDVLTTALRYPWDEGQAGVTLVVGGILTLLSPLIIPGILVLGYGLRVIEAVLDGESSPPEFGSPTQLFIRGLKGVVVIVAYVVVPLFLGLVILAFIADLSGLPLRGGLPSLARPLTVGGSVIVIALLLSGLFLVVSYLAPAALVHLGRTRRLRAAFSVEDVRGLATADVYGANWLLALSVFALAGIALAVLNAAAIGVVVSGFVTFYAFVAMAQLYADAAADLGFEPEPDLETASPNETET